MKDLATVMILQRRLNSIQRDLGPLEDKVKTQILIAILCAFLISCQVHSWLNFTFLLLQVTKLESDSDVLCSEYEGVSYTR